MPYPDDPGFKEATTSRDAAALIASETSRLRRKVLGALREYGPATADTIAERVGETILSIRPRLTELQHAFKVRDSGRRGRNVSGRMAKVFELTEEA